LPESLEIGNTTNKAEFAMVTITLKESFWATALLTAYELYEFSYDGSLTIKSTECIGLCWGRRRGEGFELIYGTATQLVEHRDENSVTPYNQFDHLTHVAWAGLDAGDFNAVGSFHSHPWSSSEVLDRKRKGHSESYFWNASQDDIDSTPFDSIGVIISLRPLNSITESLNSWKSRDLTVSGRFDLAHVTISGWYKNHSGDFAQVEVLLPDADLINKRIFDIDHR
jgi:hypothetical protein